jgi:hypothetical protein
VPMTPNSSPGGHRDHLGGATNEPSALAQRPAGSGRPLEGRRRPPRHGTRGARHGAPACIGLGTRVYPRRPAMSHAPWASTAPPTMPRVASTPSTLRSSGRGPQAPPQSVDRAVAVDVPHRHAVDSQRPTARSEARRRIAGVVPKQSCRRHPSCRRSDSTRTQAATPPASGDTRTTTNAGVGPALTRDVLVASATPLFRWCRRGCSLDALAAFRSASAAGGVLPELRWDPGFAVEAFDGAVDPDRRVPVVPLFAELEIDRALEELGMVGVAMNTTVLDRAAGRFRA